MSARLPQYSKPQFEETTQEPAHQKYSRASRQNTTEKQRSLILPASTVSSQAVPFPGTGDGFGQA